LYLVESPRRYDAVVVRAGETRTVPLGARSKVDTELVRALETWMEADAAARPKAEAALLGAALPKPLVALLAPSAKAPEKVLEHIYVSASGTFARLPWPVLIPLALRRDGVAGTGPPGVSLMSCRRVLAHVRAWNPRPGPGPMLVLADPQYRTAGKRSRQVAYFGAPLVRLTETAKEGRAIADPERGDVLFLGPEASETNLRAELFEGEYPFDVLHLACHGLLYREVPWLSALALHPAPGEDGLLTVDEIGRWRFRTGPGLVVLSACESGLGAPVAGEGEEGLVR
ncbi:MAG: CHAT domain-containing protein, partial [Planctomycetota bacterium]|nr:CHAT domain-containing protein [Planctomycetota bacterium]